MTIMTTVILAICGLLVGVSLQRNGIDLVAVTLPWIVLLLIHVYKQIEVETAWEYCQKIGLPIMAYLLATIAGFYAGHRIKA